MVDGELLRRAATSRKKRSRLADRPPRAAGHHELAVGELKRRAAIMGDRRGHGPRSGATAWGDMVGVALAKAVGAISCQGIAAEHVRMHREG